MANGIVEQMPGHESYPCDHRKEEKMKYYLFIRPDEDGNPARIVDEERFLEILEEHADNPPISFAEYQKHTNPNYWKDGQWFAVRVIPISIAPIQTITKLGIVAEGE